jgi:hypothetical protein
VILKYIPESVYDISQNKFYISPKLSEDILNAFPIFVISLSGITFLSMNRVHQYGKVEIKIRIVNPKYRSENISEYTLTNR